MILANLLSALMMVLFGILIKYGQLYDLIAGYNTASDEERKKTDIKSLGKFIGNSLLVLSGILVIGAALEYLELSGAGAGSWIAFTAIIVYVVIKAQSFKEYG